MFTIGFYTEQYASLTERSQHARLENADKMLRGEVAHFGQTYTLTEELGATTYTLLSQRGYTIVAIPQ